ncbi:TCR/Tet family MFS transporter [Melittangium boletus]|uniref:Tetracycline resistance MFS efflux pump n=1 Tax=Melittangium boletus DSM 14713 TaxID=1294270 RepID=A0A250IA93_9BACT|nr:TCR/Tet family MFS transporter [Melittangium boletus]ATB28779.1 tetracycline resistance MFS efflux pump [Melittangium boletus DSM 14713]
MNDPSPSSAPRRAALVFIFITVLLDVLAMGMIIPVLPGIVTGFLGGDAVRTAEVLGLFATVWAVMQFVASPVLGALSDRYGRRPLVLLSNFGLGLDYILMALAPDLSWLFVGRLISGITSASISTASAYIADVTPPDKRAASYGLLGAAFGVGFVMGPALGGLLGDANPHLPFWVAAGLSLANALYGLFVLPESLPPERRTAFAWKNANPVGSLLLLRALPGVLGLTGVYFVYHLAQQAIYNLFVLYGNHRYGWGESTVGLTLALVGVLSLVVQGGLVRPVVRALGERRTLLLGLSMDTLGFLAIALATTGIGFWAAQPLLALGGFFGPASQGLMSNRVSAGLQGQFQGALAGLQSITGIIGPALFTQTFAFAIDPRLGWNLPGAPFLLAALLILLSLGLAAWSLRPGERTA